jgi:hypothetical protein
MDKDSIQNDLKTISLSLAEVRQVLSQRQGKHLARIIQQKSLKMKRACAKML